MASRPKFGEHSAKFTLVVALSSLLFGIGMIYTSSQPGGPPPRKSLAEVQGTVAWTMSYRHGIRFGFSGDARSFVYPSKSRELGLVEQTLTRSDHPRVSILFDPKTPGGPVFSDEKYFDVHEISVDGNVARSYEQVREAWAADDRVGIWLGVVFVISGLGLGLCLRQEVSAR
jgi:hypothetical protein